MNNIQLNDNQQLLQALNNHALVSITDLTGNSSYANDLFCETSGYSAAELIGQNHSIVNSGYHSDEFICHLWRTISNWTNIINWTNIFNSRINNSKFVFNNNFIFNCSSNDILSRNIISSYFNNPDNHL